MKQNSFTLSKQKGVQFSNLTGDINKIHIDENYAYNSIYGFTIVHGILLFSNFIKRINYYKKLKYYRSIHIYFANPTKYNELITYKNNKVNNYELFQNKKQILSINFSKEKNNIKINNLKKHIYKKNFIISKQIKKKYINNIMPIDLYICLGFLTKYVGVIFPGENSLINEIKVFKNKYFLKSKKMTVNSYVVDKRFPIIHNILLYKNYTIEFKSIIRPKLKFSFKLPSRKIIKEIKGLNRNVLIIGSSSGIGYDLMKLFMYNKKIKIISTFYINKIFEKQKNLITLKIDITKDLYKIYNLIKKYNPNIYYFATPRISQKDKDVKLLNKYKKYYINYPIKLIKFSNKLNLNFFYPSTSYLNENKKLNTYTTAKLNAEKILNKIDNKNQLTILRIPEINTKQNLSIYKKKLINFRDFIFKNKNLFRSVFFNK